MEVSINYWAVLVATLASMIIGSLWYSPLLFMKPWLRMLGGSPDHKGDGSPVKAIAMAGVGAFITAYVLAHFVDLLEITNLTMAYQFVFWAWLGLIAPFAANEYIFSLKPKPWGLFWLTHGNVFLTLLVMITILVQWN
jgi:hypothetical protein